MKRPWYRHVAGGQGRTPEDLERLADALIVATCFAVVALIAAWWIFG